MHVCLIILKITGMIYGFGTLASLTCKSKDYTCYLESSKFSDTQHEFEQICLIVIKYDGDRMANTAAPDQTPMLGPV